MSATLITSYILNGFTAFVNIIMSKCRCRRYVRRNLPSRTQRPARSAYVSLVFVVFRLVLSVLIPAVRLLARKIQRLVYHRFKTAREQDNRRDDRAKTRYQTADRRAISFGSGNACAGHSRQSVQTSRRRRQSYTLPRLTFTRVPTAAVLTSPLLLNPP